MASDELGLSKKSLANKLGVSVSSLYYKPKKPQADWNLKNQIEKVLHEHPSYGHKRLAVASGYKELGTCYKVNAKS